MVSINRGAPLPVVRQQDSGVQKKQHAKSDRLQSIKQRETRQVGERQQVAALGREGEDFGPDARSVAAQLEEFVANSDNMSMLAGQFRRFGDLNKKSGEVSENFERVLDEDSHPKAQQIMKIAKMQDVSGDELLRQARNLFPDESDLIIVLREMLRRRGLDEIVRIRLQQALAQAEDEAPPKAVKAGINIALKAKLFGAKLAMSALLLRASYRQFLESEEHEVMIYEEWVASYGHERRALVMEFLESALVADMLSQDPSCSRIEFGNLLGKLNQLKLLRSSETLFIDSMLNDPLTRAHNNKEADWLVFMLGLMQAPQELDGLLMATVGEEILLSSHAVRSRLLQSIRHACRELPRNLFVEEESVEDLWERFRQLAAVSFRREMMEMRSGGSAVTDLFDGRTEASDAPDADEENDSNRDAEDGAQDNKKDA